jgi:hypothetical protein
MMSISVRIDHVGKQTARQCDFRREGRLPQTPADARDKIRQCRPLRLVPGRRCWYEIALVRESARTLRGPASEPGCMRL